MYVYGYYQQGRWVSDNVAIIVPFNSKEEHGTDESYVLKTAEELVTPLEDLLNRVQDERLRDYIPTWLADTLAKINGYATTKQIEKATGWQ